MKTTPPALRSPIFVMGPGRSGTTLVRSVLTAHSRIAITPETHFPNWSAHREGAEADAPADFERFWADLVAWSRFADLEVAPERVRALVDGAGDRRLRTIYAALLQAYAERVGKPRSGDKTPGNVRHVERLLDWFPNARVVLLQRDPRAVVASQLQTPWVAPHVAPAGVRSGLLVRSRLRQVVRFADDWAEIHGPIAARLEGDPRVTTVAYEGFVQAPEEETKRLCAFLGEAYESGMLQARDAHTVPDARGGSGAMGDDWAAWRARHQEQSREAVTAEYLDRWRAQLSRAEIAVVEARCAGPMRKAGYGLDAGRLRRGSGRALRAGVRVGHAAESGARSLARLAAKATLRRREA
jgi:hypothetical protein